MPSNRSRLQVEALEDRLVLSTFPALSGLATEVLRFLPLGLPSTATTAGSQPSISGFSGATGVTDPNLLGFGPADQGIPGLTATAGPANFLQTAAALAGQTGTTGQTTPSTGLTQAQAAVLTEFAAARLAAAQFLAIEAAQNAATTTTTTTPTTTTTTTTTTPTTTPTTPPNATLLAAEVFVAQLAAARVAVLSAQAQSGSSASTSGVFANPTAGANAAIPSGGFFVFPATGSTGSGVFNGFGGGANAAIPAGGFSVGGTSQSTGSLFTSLLGTGTQSTSTTSSSNTTNPLGGANPFNNALANSGLSIAGPAI